MVQPLSSSSSSSRALLAASGTNQPKFKAQSHARERCAGFCEPVKYVARFPLQITGGRKFVRKGMGIRWGRREGSAFLPDEEQC